MVHARMVLLCALVLLAAGCQVRPDGLPRRGSHIVACGYRFDIGAPVVLWTERGGYSAYDEAKNDGSPGPSPRFGSRLDQLEAHEAGRIEQHGWDLPALQGIVDQFVIHYDAAGTSAECFRILRRRGLSSHFLLDLDGTIYQTLDLQERAWHATTSNGRSIGVEIAHVGAFAVGEPDANEEIALAGSGGPSTGNGEGGPRSGRMVLGRIQDRLVRQSPFTARQYRSLAKLTAGLCRLFPNLPCDYPRDAGGELITNKLPDPQLAAYRGIIGHYHIQADKIDPGPAFEWDRVVTAARRELRR